MLKNVLICEASTDNLTNTTSPEKKKLYRMEGEFTRFKVKNRNERIYTPENFLPCVDELLERKKTLGVVFGEYDHPSVFDTQLQRASHTIESLVYDKINNSVRGEIKLLSNHWGTEARCLVNDECPLFISSRSAGTTNDDGIVEVRRLFTFDIVGDPGFATSRISLKCLNESFNYSNDVNFRIYDLTQESNFNNLIMDNDKKLITADAEFATREQVREYSNYIVREMNELKNKIANSSKTGQKDEELMAYFENTNALISKMGNYLDYLSTKVQVAIDKTVVLETKTETIIDQCDMLAETIENTVEYAQHIAENTKTNIESTELALSKIKEVTEFTEHIAEHVDSGHKFIEHVAEHVENGHKFTEYVAGNTAKIIDYGQYLKEHVENIINHNDYLAETLNQSIKFTEHISEHVQNVIGNVQTVMGYSEYLGDNLGKTIEFVEYTAESANKAINYTERVVESLKLNSLNESSVETIGIPTFEDFEAEYADEHNPDEYTDGIEDNDFENQEDEDDSNLTEEERAEKELQRQNLPSETDQTSEEIEEDEMSDNDEIRKEETKEDEEAMHEEEEVALESFSKGTIVRVNSIGKIGRVVNMVNENVTVDLNGKYQTFEKSNLTIKKAKKSSITESVKTLIDEIKRKDAAANVEPHFFTFLNQKQKNEFRALSETEREKVNVAFMENRTYASTRDVQAIIADALNENKPTFKDTLVNNIPVDLFPIWEELNDSERGSILEQSEFYDLSNSTLMESFWRTRNYPKKDERTLILESNRQKSTDTIDEIEREKFLTAYKKIGK